MTDEDLTAAKLKGHNCFIKFKDGEELFLTIEDISEDVDDANEFLVTIEKFINRTDDDDDLVDNRYTQGVFPVGNIAVSRDSVKYVRII